ncbi:MAG: ribosomal RNA small subunit methyltransferase A [Clostridia bacterium]|nr:ribosomal RNA small subunit methyltransferase A [Clostridia bacterium]
MTENGLSLGLRARVALEANGFHFTHSIGQNFILDEDVIGDIVSLAGVCEGDNILEIGPGSGMMTAMMADRGAKVLAIELDRALENVLRDVIGDRNVKIVFQDAMKADITLLAGEYFGTDAPYKIVANLPYYITADFLMRAVTLQRKPESITVMVQKEAAERVMSSPGDKNWSALSATLKYFSEAEFLMEAPRTLFTPPPHVDSALIRLNMRKQRPLEGENETRFLRFIQAAFRMRRKTLANNLSSDMAIPREKAVSAIEGAGFDARIRGEALEIEELVGIFENLVQE